MFVDDQTANIQAAIVGGNIVQNTVPWMVALIKHDERDAAKGQFCGGTLIAPQWVLTAAHCPIDLRNELNYYGDIDVAIGQNDLSGAVQRIKVIREVIHPDYDSFSSYNDIALLYLETPSQSQTVSLFSPNISDEEVVNFGSSWILGWGYTSANGGKSSKLKEASLALFSNSTCDNPWLPSWFHFAQNDKDVCAGMHDGSADACNGDSGGPLLVLSNNEWYQLGITSYGTPGGCGKSGALGVYEKVPKHGVWIQSTLCDSGGCSTPTPTSTPATTPTAASTLTPGGTLHPTSTATPATTPAPHNCSNLGQFDRNYAYLFSAKNCTGDISWFSAHDPNGPSANRQESLYIPDGSIVNVSSGDNNSGETQCFTSSIADLDVVGWANRIQWAQLVIEGDCTLATSTPIPSCTVPGTPSLIWPQEGTQIVTGSHRLTWNTSSQATYYLFELATDSSFSTIINSGFTSNSYVDTIALKPGMHYWRVRARNQVPGICIVYGSYSNTQTFRVSGGFSIPKISMVDSNYVEKASFESREQRIYRLTYNNQTGSTETGTFAVRIYNPGGSLWYLSADAYQFLEGEQNWSLSFSPHTLIDGVYRFEVELIVQGASYASSMNYSIYGNPATPTPTPVECREQGDQLILYDQINCNGSSWSSPYPYKFTSPVTSKSIHIKNMVFIAYTEPDLQGEAYCINQTISDLSLVHYPSGLQLQGNILSGISAVGSDCLVLTPTPTLTKGPTATSTPIRTPTPIVCVDEDETYIFMVYWRIGCTEGGQGGGGKWNSFAKDVEAIYIKDTVAVVYSQPNMQGEVYCINKTIADLRNLNYPSGLSLFHNVKSAWVQTGSSCTVFTPTATLSPTPTVATPTPTSTATSTPPTCDKLVEDVDNYILYNKVGCTGQGIGGHSLSPSPWLLLTDISSVYVNNRALIVFSEKDFKGEAQCITTTIPDLRTVMYPNGRTLYHNVNSLKVISGTQCSLEMLKSPDTPKLQEPVPNSEIAFGEEIILGWNWQEYIASFIVEVHSTGLITKQIGYTQNQLNIGKLPIGLYRVRIQAHNLFGQYSQWGDYQFTVISTSEPSPSHTPVPTITRTVEATPTKTTPAGNPTAIPQVSPVEPVNFSYATWFSPSEEIVLKWELCQGCLVIGELWRNNTLTVKLAKGNKAEWNLGNLPMGKYLVRLQTYKPDGFTYFDWVDYNLWVEERIYLPHITR